MHPEQQSRKRQKTIAWFIVIMAVVIVTVGVSALKNKQQTSSDTAINRGNNPDMSKSVDGDPSTGSSNSGTGSSSATYKDGSYSANGKYQTPGGQESITVSVTIQGGTVTDSSIQNQPSNSEAEEYQGAFIGGYKQYVVGKKLSDIKLSRVSGSSLTSSGFNAALEQIKSQAQTL